MPSRTEPVFKRRFVTSDDVRAAAARGDGVLAVDETWTVTDEARELALKHGLRIQERGSAAAPPAQHPTAGRVPPPAAGPSASPPAVAHPTLPEDLAGRVAQAVHAVLRELDLGERAAILQPIVTRRVFAGLSESLK